jgi:hypothetical protein
MLINKKLREIPGLSYNDIEAFTFFGSIKCNIAENSEENSQEQGIRTLVLCA